jgi:hypothetical protein
MEQPVSPTRSVTRQQAQLIAENFLSPSYARLRPSGQQGAPVLGSSVSSTCPISGIQVLLACCMIAAIILAFRVDRSELIKWLTWARTRRHEGRALFILAYVASLILMVPGSVLALLAGVHAIIVHVR